MSLVNIASTKQEGECHSSTFYGLVKNEKINERLMRGHNKSNTAEKKGGSKQECMNLKAFRESTHDEDDDKIKEEANADAFTFDFTHYQ
jgi:hypothetical protein